MKAWETWTCKCGRENPATKRSCVCEPTPQLTIKYSVEERRWVIVDNNVVVASFNSEEALKNTLNRIGINL